MMRTLGRIAAIAFLALLLRHPGGALPAVVAAAPASAAATCAPGQRPFEATDQCVPAVFAAYWASHGGLAQQGWPIGPAVDEVNPTDGKTYLTQYFERARFELHPEHAGTPYEVLLGLLGREQLRAKYGGVPPSGVTGNPLGVNCALFEQTGKQVCGIFLDYWAAHGGLAQQGLPLTDLFIETNPTDGKPYLTQYFERARFEFHPENQGTEYVVLLGLLGREQYHPPDGKVILRDDFTDPTSGWPVVADPQGRYSLGYLPGEYRITLAAADSFAVATNRAIGALADVWVEADFTRSGPEQGPSFGFACRVDAPDRFYGAVVDTRGSAMLFKVVGDEFVLLVAVSDSPAIKRDNETNRLRLECVGPQLTLRANGSVVATAQDGGLGSGTVGFLALSFAQGGLELHIRDFIAAQP